METYLYENEIEEGKMISNILQIHAEFPYLRTLYGRRKQFNDIPQEYELYKIFYPVDYYDDPYAPKNPDYQHMCEYIAENSYNFIIQDKSVVIYDETSNTYYSITYLIDKCGNYPIFENEQYSVYRFEYE